MSLLGKIMGDNRNANQPALFLRLDMLTQMIKS